jgi:RimJ/RimL family protein N-acetyltransferase
VTVPALTLNDFACIHLPALSADEVLFNVQIAAIETALNTPAGFAYWSLGAPGHCATMTPGRSLLLGQLDTAECAELARITRFDAYPGVVGPEPAITQFVSAATDLGLAFAQPIPMRLHTLIHPPVQLNCPGTARPVVPADAPLLFDWMTAFHLEAVPHNAPPQWANVEKSAASGRYAFWTVGDVPVSVACINRTLRTTCAVGAVFTPPIHRGRGYAGAIVAALCARILADGKQSACLYTDLRNPASNRCYAKIGFKPRADAATYVRLS